MMRTPASCSRVREPLSKTITSCGATLWFLIESMQSRSIAPPSISSTMTSTSLMIHPIEKDGAGQTTELGPPVSCDHHARCLRAISCWRQRIRLRPDLEDRRLGSAILQLRRSAERENAHRVAGVQNPAPAEHETLNLELLRIERAPAMDHVRVFEFDAGGRAAAEEKREGEENDHE